MTLRIPLCCCLVAYLLATTTQPALANDQRPELHLSVFDHGPGVESLLSGDYHHAVSTAKKWRRLQQPLAALITLCAAHLKFGHLSEAETPCKEASVMGARPGTVVGTSRKNKRATQAMVMSNLGVLNVLKGDVETGKAHFRKALKLDKDNRVARNNLEVAQQQDFKLALLITQRL